MLPESFSLESGYAVFKPAGEYTFDRSVEMVDEAIEFCRTAGIRRLLVDLTGITGFPPPTTIERFIFATKWAETAGREVIMAMIAPTALIDPDKIGVVIANNRGLRTDVFTNESEAIAWLLRSDGLPTAA